MSQLLELTRQERLVIQPAHGDLLPGKRGLWWCDWCYGGVPEDHDCNPRLDLARHIRQTQLDLERTLARPSSRRNRFLEAAAMWTAPKGIVHYRPLPGLLTACWGEPDKRLAVVYAYEGKLWQPTAHDVVGALARGWGFDGYDLTSLQAPLTTLAVVGARARSVLVAWGACGPKQDQREVLERFNLVCVHQKAKPPRRGDLSGYRSPEPFQWRT